MFRVIKREPGVIVFMLLEDNALEFWVCLTLCGIYCPYINLEKLQKFQCFICGQVKSDARRVCQDKPAVAYACSVPFNNCDSGFVLTHPAGIRFDLTADEALELLQFLKVYIRTINTTERETNPELERIVIKEHEDYHTWLSFYYPEHP